MPTSPAIAAHAPDSQQTNGVILCAHAGHGPVKADGKALDVVVCGGVFGVPVSRAASMNVLSVAAC